MADFHFSRRNWLKTAALATTPVLLGALPVATSTAAPAAGKTPALTVGEIAAIEAALGKKGNYVEAQATHTTPLPRNDLKVTIKGEPVPISFGFGGWVAIKHTLDGKSAMLMSDTVLLQEEVNPLMSAALANGLEIGAVHNHFFYEEPRIFYMHVHGMGTPAELARKFAATLKDSKLLPANQPPALAPAPAQAGTNATPSAGPPTGKDLFDLPALDRLVGYPGVVNGPTYKYTVGRADLQPLMMGTEMTAAIGLNSWAAFAGKQADAHIAGDVAMLEAEVNPVIKALRAHNLEVVAVHNHMLFDQPRMMFLHYYGRGPAAQLAQGFRAALDQLGRGKPGGMKRMTH
ncbi:DUF1259 domain-containing protein [Hymenobacter glacialis]|uniref:Peptidase M23 n=1 Tax=Hymenobacter glacialis TaxID=1908236 RepID=A0A1G1TDG5_9BACT|nr:DUF1259 domain-containing protein [Hymenobacter glacialis]OGX88904.1 hypothetical protein BEN48_08130 [Hymenobacter glacialis]